MRLQRLQPKIKLQIQLKNYEIFFYQLLKLEDLEDFSADIMGIICSSVNRTLKGSLG